MYRRENINFSHPPQLKSPPPMSSPLDSNRSYRWTSLTAANNSKFADTPVKETPQKPDMSWWSPSRGDTWRLNAPRGRTLDLVAAFDQCSRQDQLDSPRYANLGRYRRNSEPMQDNEKEVVTTNFIDDSMIEDHEEYEEHDIELGTDFYDPHMIRHHRSSERFEQSLGTGQQIETIHISTRLVPQLKRVPNSDYANDGRGDMKEYGSISKKNETPILDGTPKRPSPLTTRNIHKVDINRMDHLMKTENTVAGFITLTPQVSKVTHKSDFSKHFGQEESVRASPMSRRNRRGTQTIVLPSFDSPASVRKSIPSPGLPTKTDIRSPSSLVKSIANDFEKADFGFHRKIDAAEEIAQLRKRADNSTFDENQNMVSDSAEDNVSNDFVPRISHLEMHPSVHMGISGYAKKNHVPYGESNEEVLYSLPIKKQSRNVDREGMDQTDEILLTPRAITMRQSLPFSDIPEERTCDKIDEMFDFVEVPTGDYDDKTTLERTVDGYAEVKSQKSPNKMIRNRLDLSTNTYQEIEFEKDTTPYMQEFEEDGTGYSASSSGPQFTRSPTLVTPHAGQSVAEYRVSDKEGCAKTEKVVVQKMSQPSALATSTPKGTFAWRNKNQSNAADDSFVSSISNFSAADKINDSKRQISKLIETIEKTRKHIQLAEISLIDAKRAQMVVQELASQRVLLICRERLKLQLDEVRRLQALSVVRHPPPPINRHFKSAMVISNIAIHLNKNFNCRGSFAFIVALKCRTEIEATGVVTLLAHYQTRMHVIHFGEHMHFSNLPVDFVIAMEVYMMRVPEYKAPEKTCAAVLAAKFRNLLVPNSAHRRARNNSVLSNRTVLSMPGYQAPDCDFRFCGKLTLDRDSAGDRQFYLDDVTYPLEGTVKLQSHCSSLPEAIDVEYRGFLYLFDERSPNGEAAWDRYWAMLHRGIIFFWKNPIDEKNQKVPLSQIDLTKCTNQSVEETRNGRDHEFHIELLIDQTPSLLEKRRVVLAAESSDHLASWLNAINDTLFVLRS
ncbi:Anillin-like protein 2 [Caenorhabditis elegans]|uniref:Anillin-like protein 2 n=1 Tax=Caenorhabditis elegans TaxID=6239 RepID=ANI2_CAEEL|nr:Anillin-like protein 2 [Caenorhabditis elegans]Q09994.1 RecName: Full=Anillin-like protein 2 [Caenorhabditis elegans]CCD66397.1 Anillin-like protein 2 [Caenorhabditis elegans]|eukprot:NP_495282.1 Anillin-like protein 2 [Caenorhabditis elegans]